MNKNKKGSPIQVTDIGSASRQDQKIFVCFSPKNSYMFPVLWILFGFNADPDQEFLANADPDPVPNPDPGF